VRGERGHGFAPYWAPLFSFLVLVAAAQLLPWPAAAGLLPLRVGVPLALLLVFARRGSYPELRGYRPGGRGLAADIGAGIAGGALWMAPYLAFPALRPAPEAAFDPGLFGPEWVPAALALRALGYTAVTPFAEELFARSWLHRYVQALQEGADFRDLPVARPRRSAFAAVVVYWVISHALWEAPVAVAWSALSTLWLYRRGHLMSVVVLHAASNGTIFLAAALASGRIPDANGAPLDLWFFL
jgi:CAAX prenyl protease-like protein